MSVDWKKVSADFWNEQPHPNGHGLKIGELATMVKLATSMKFGGHASMAEAALFAPEFKATGMSPQEFEHTLDRLAPLSYTYHGRPPTMHEMASLKDKSPAEAHKYFADLPDKHYPHVSAGNMVKAMQAAEPHAQQHLERPALKNEAARLHHSGEDPAVYYARVASLQPKIPSSASNVDQTPLRPDFAGRGLASSGGPPPDQRTASGGGNGLSA